VGNVNEDSIVLLNEMTAQLQLVEKKEKGEHRQKGLGT
jgi:hypothetical protein